VVIELFESKYEGLRKKVNEAIRNQVPLTNIKNAEVPLRYKLIMPFFFYYCSNSLIIGERYVDAGAAKKINYVIATANLENDAAAAFAKEKLGRITLRAVPESEMISKIKKEFHFGYKFKDDKELNGTSPTIKDLLAYIGSQYKGEDLVHILGNLNQLAMDKECSDLNDAVDSAGIKVPDKSRPKHAVFPSKKLLQDKWFNRVYNA